MKPKFRIAFPSSLSIALGLFAIPSVAFSQNYTWSGTLDGTAAGWNVDANWAGTPNAFPNAVGDIANLTGNFTAAKTINLNAATTVGSLTLQDTTTAFVGLTLAPNGGSLIFDNTGSTNAVLVSAGATNSISSGIQLNDSLDITTTTSLTISGLISSTGAQNLTKATAAGNTLTLTNNLNSYTGTTSVANGTLAATLTGNIAISTDSVLGNSATAIIHGTAATTGNSAIQFNASTDATNYTISRGFDFTAGGATTSTASINLGGNNAGNANTNTLTLAGSLALSATNKPAAIRALYSGQTVNITGNITQTAGTGVLTLGTFPSAVSATDGRGSGTIRFSNLSRDYLGSNNLIAGTVLIDGVVPATATASPIGRTAVNLNQGSGGNIFGGANFGTVVAANDTSLDTIRAVFLDSAGSSYARVLAPGVGSTTSPLQTGFNKVAAVYASEVAVMNGFQFGGKNTSGTTTFSGNIAPDDVKVGANTTGNVVITSTNIALIAENGGTTVFSGVISDTPLAGTEARLTINQFRNNPHLDGVNNASGNAGGQTATIGSDGIVDAAANALVGTAKTGTVQLSGNNAYVGTTEVLGGTLQLGNAKGLGIGGRQANATGTTTVASGAVLDLNGQTAINEPIILNGTGVSSGGALVNNSGTAASIDNGVAGIHLGTVFGSGSGYSTAPTVTITGGSGSGATTATASLGLSSASITSVSGGSGWVVGDTVNITGGGGVGAIGQVTSIGGGGSLTGISILKPGSGYTTAPNGVSKADASGVGITTGLFLTGNATNFTVAGLNLGANSGTGYTSTPAVNFSSGSASATAVLSSVTLASDSSIGGTGDITINAVISESGGARGLSKVGAGTTTLNATNTYTGATDVTDGKLILNGNISTSSLVTVSGSGILAGTGTAGATSVTSGTLAIGNSAGTMNLGSLSLGAGSTYLYELTGGGTSADLGDISGALSINTGSILDLVQLGTYTVGDRFTLFAYDGALTGNFNGLTDGATFTDAGGDWMIDYNDALAGLNGGVSASNTFVTITAVPEPGVAALLGGFAMLALVRRRRTE